MYFEVLVLGELRRLHFKNDMSLKLGLQLYRQGREMWHVVPVKFGGMEGTWKMYKAP